MGMATPVMEQNTFRGRNDDGSESAASWIDIAGNDWTQDAGSVFRVRFLIKETAGASVANVTPQLQYNLGGAGWNNVNASSSVVRSAASSYFADDDNTTQQLGAGTFITPNSGMDEDNGLAGENSDMDFAGSDECEAEFSIIIVPADVSESNTIELRVINSATPLDTYTDSPTITVGTVPDVVPADIIFLFKGNNADIPVGWTRETAFDSKYVRGTTGNGGGTGGSTTHTHTVTGTHTHSDWQHTHNISSSSYSGKVTSSLGSDKFTQAPHTHSGNSNQASAAAVFNTASVGSVGTANNDSLYKYEMIFIKSAALTPIHDGMIGWYFGDTNPTNWDNCDGSNSTPDLRNRFIRGAAAGQDAGTTADSNNNYHTHIGAGHTHTLSAGGTHDHGTTTVAGGTGGVSKYDVGGTDVASKAHTHDVESASQSFTIETATPTYYNVSDPSPVHRQLKLIQNNTGGGDIPTAIIGLWIGTLGSVPTGWNVCDGTSTTPDMDGNFVKTINVEGDLDATGGAATHYHTSTHSHTGVDHTHSVVSDTASTELYQVDIIDRIIDVAKKNHTHGTWTIADATNNSPSAVVVTNSSSSEASYPEYVEAIFLQYGELPSAGVLSRLTLLGAG